MKNTLITSALVAILGLAFISTPVSAQTTNTATATAPAKTKAKSDKIQYKGSITAIDATSVTVAGKTTLTLAIDAKTKFEVNKKAATAADFAVGDAITGSYTKDATGAMTAYSIHKKTASAAAAAKPAATPATN